MLYTIGTRGSALALAQTSTVRDALASRFPEHTFALKVIRTAGDRNQTVPLSGIGTRGVFVKEIEEALLSGAIDLAVHSMKDMPAEQPEGLTLAPCWNREDPRDALILRRAASLDALSQGAVVGTGSLRRSVQLQALRPDLNIVGLRGNIDTRLKKLESENLDGIVLACAGLNRLGLSGHITQRLSPDEMIPAAAQGVLALEYACRRADVAAMLGAMADPRTDACVRAERAFLRLAGGGCFLPVGAYCEPDENGYRLRAIYGDAEGKNVVRAEASAADPEEAARIVWERIRAQ